MLTFHRKVDKKKEGMIEIAYTGNDSNGNYYLRYVNNNGNPDNNNSNAFGVRPIASINWGYAIKDCISEYIETDYAL